MNNLLVEHFFAIFGLKKLEKSGLAVRPFQVRSLLRSSKSDSPKKSLSRRKQKYSNFHKFEDFFLVVHRFQSRAVANFRDISTRFEHMEKLNLQIILAVHASLKTYFKKIRVYSNF